MGPVPGLGGGGAPHSSLDLKPRAGEDGFPRMPYLWMFVAFCLLGTLALCVMI